MSGGLILGVLFGLSTSISAQTVLAFHWTNPDILVASVMVFYNLIYSVSSLLYGWLSDKIGRAPIILVGGIALTSSFLSAFVNLPIISILFFAVSRGSFMPAALAWISEKKGGAQALGDFQASYGIANLVGCSLLGLVAEKLGSVGFLIFSFFPVLATLWVLILSRTN